MEENLLPILIAITIIVAVWGIAQFAMGLMRGDKRKLAQRLSTDARTEDKFANPGRSITKEIEATGMPAFLAETDFVQNLHKRVLQAWPELTVLRFVTITVAIAAAFALIGSLVFGNGFVGLIGAAVGAYIPFFVLNSKRAKRQKLLGDQLPEALDFLGRILKAGHSLTTGLQMMADELPKPLATEFRRCYDQHSLGTPLEDSLKDMVTRVQSTDFAFFVTAILIQRQTGGDLSEVLGNISGMIRDRLRLQNQVKSKTAEGRFTGYILVAFPAVMFVVSYTMNREYAGVLLHGTGLILLGAAFGLQMLGLVAIRKITTVRV